MKLFRRGRELRLAYLMALIIIFVALVPAATFGLVFLQGEINRVRALQLDRLQNLSESSTELIQKRIETYRSVLASMRQVLEAEDRCRSAECYAIHLQPLTDNYPGIISALFIDSKGLIDAVAVSNRRPDLDARRAVGQSVADRSYFADAVADRDVQVSNVFRGRGIGQDTVVGFSARVDGQDGALLGVIQFSIDAQSLVELPMLGLPRREFAAIVLDGANRVVAASDPKTYPAMSDFERLPAFDQREHDSAETQIRVGRNQYWRLLLSRPRHESQAVLQAAAGTGGVLAFSLLLLTLLAMRFGRLLSKPFQRMADYLDQIGSNGDALQGTLVLEGLNSAESRQLEVSVGGLVKRLRKVEVQYMRAIKSRDRLNRELHELIDAQESLIRQRTQDLSDALKAAEKLAQTRSALLANTSHEIRTPLNGIIGTVELLLTGEWAAHERRELQTVLKLAESLLQLINDILDLSRISGDGFRLSPEPTAIAAEVAAVADALAPLVRRNRLELQLVERSGTAPYYMLDPLRLRQVLLNLVGNALKFTERGGVRIRWAALDRGEGAVIDVVDSGIGMSREQLTEIFKPFVQLANQANRRFQGTGLGLSIVKALVESMGGQLTVRSKLGWGSRFRVVLPAAIAQPPMLYIAPTDHWQITAGRSVRVLVVDDVEVNRNLMRAQLESMDCTVEVAEGGYEALSLLERESFDLMLLDCQMPGLDGYQTALQARKLLQGRSMRIVAVTAGASSLERQKCLDAGMDDYATKPLRLRVVQQLVAETMRLATMSIEID